MFKLMCILAHPDDESLGTGGILAKYAAEGIETYLLTATRGQAGWLGAAVAFPGGEVVGQLRQAELEAAADVLGVQEMVLLDYQDGQLAAADANEAICEIATHLRRIRPDVVVTFDMFGSYGHPDHIAIAQWTTAAVVVAAQASYGDGLNQVPHQVQKLYYLASTTDLLTVYQAALGDLVMVVNGQERRAQGWPEWAITSWIETKPYWRQVWQAVICHKTQLPSYAHLQQLTPEQHYLLWGQQSFYRVFSLVESPLPETDLFAGLR